MSPPNLVQIGPRVFLNSHARIGAPPKTGQKFVVNHQNSDYDHVTPDLPQTFKGNGAKVKVIA